jgi:hypothetical protein
MGAKKQYGPITFAEDYNKSFASFKKEFSGIWFFKEMEPKKREKELRKAYKVTKSTKRDGNTSGASKPSKED